MSTKKNQGGAAGADKSGTSTQVQLPEGSTPPKVDEKKTEEDKQKTLRESQAEQERQERERELTDLRTEVADLKKQLREKDAELSLATEEIKAANQEIERQRVVLNKVRVGAIEVPDGSAQLTESVTFIESLGKTRVDGKLGDVVVRDGNREQVEKLREKYGKQTRVYALASKNFDELVRLSLAQPGA